MEQIFPFQYLIDEAEKKLFSACQFAYLKNGKKESGFFGTFSFEDFEKIDGNTQFDLASLTKVLFTVTIFYKLMHEKVISGNDKMGKYFKTVDDTVRVIDLLQHTSGCPAWLPFFDLIPCNSSVEEKKRMAEKIIFESRRDDRSKCYSDLNFLLLGFILEKITAQSLDDIFEKFKISNELQHNIGFFPEKKIPLTAFSNLRKSFPDRTVEDENCYFFGGMCGHAGLFASAETMVNFIDNLLKKQWFLEIGQSCDYAGFDFPEGENSNYGKNIRKGFVGHLGFTGTAFLVDTESKMVAALLTNCTHPDPEKPFRRERIKKCRQTFFNGFFQFFIFIFIFISCSTDKSDDIYDYNDIEKNDSDTAVLIKDKDSFGTDFENKDFEDVYDETEDVDIVDEEDVSVPDWEPDLCTPNPCIMENSDGICKVSEDGFKCGCNENYFWMNGICVLDPCLSSPCQGIENSTGQCKKDGAGYICICDNGYFWEKDMCEVIPDIVFVKSDATGNNDGTSWKNAFKDFTDAMDSLNEPETKKWIWVAKGTYKPKKAMNVYFCGTKERCFNFALKNNVSVFCGFAGNEDSVDNRDFLKNESVFSGDIDNSGDFSEGDAYNVFLNFNLNETAVFDGCIIEAGNADYDDGDIKDLHMKHGGGMNNLNEVNAIIKNAVFRNNRAIIMGGAMANSNNSKLKIENSIFENNIAFKGGAIGNSLSSPEIASNIFRNNSTNKGYGGAIFNFEESSPEITSCFFENNVSNDGGAIVNSGFSHAKIIGSVFRNNIANRGGGAISNSDNSNCEIINSFFDSNRAEQGGGAVEIYQDCASSIINSKFYNNSTAKSFFGGAVLVTTSGLNIINSLFAGNYAQSGGAIASQWSVTSIINSTLVFNRAIGENSYGGGIYNVGKVTKAYITNSIFSSNYSEMRDNEISNDLSNSEISCSSITDAFHGGAWNEKFGKDNGGNLDSDPMFNDVKNGDFSLKFESPCIDKGDNSPFEAEGVAENILKDILGNDRIINRVIDLGAYENVR